MLIGYLYIFSFFFFPVSSLPLASFSWENISISFEQLSVSFVHLKIIEVLFKLTYQNSIC